MESEERPSKRIRTESPSEQHDRQSESPESSSQNVTDQNQPDIASADGEGKPISKNQQKKLRRKALWESKKDDRKAKRKERAQRTRNRKRTEKEEAIKNGISIQQNPQINGVLVPVSVIIDCSFNDLMFEHELKSLAGQISRCYSENRKAKYKMFLSISSFEGTLKVRFDEGLGGTYKNWTNDARFCSEDFVAVSNVSGQQMISSLGQIDRSDWSRFGSTWDSWVADYRQQNLTDLGDSDHSKLQWDEMFTKHGEVIYLSSEGEETLQELKPCSTYIIGGLVDHNRHKGICHQRAKERGIKTAKLPIGDYLKMSSRQVLATNHVLEILLKWMENGDWEEAFTAVIPKRKDWKLKNEENCEVESAELVEKANDKPQPEEVQEPES